MVSSRGEGIMILGVSLVGLWLVEETGCASNMGANEPAGSVVVCGVIMYSHATFVTSWVCCGAQCGGSGCRASYKVSLFDLFRARVIG